MYSKPATRWMTTALLLSPLHSMPGLCKLALEARDSEKIACISGTPFCFPQAFDDFTGISVALILPSELGTDVDGSGFLPLDFIASVSTPLPYGFAGMGGSNESEIEVRSAAALGEISAAWWDPLRSEATLLPAQSNRFTSVSDQNPSSAPLVQIFAKSLTKNVLTRVQSPLDAGAKITISPRSSQSATASHMVFRCQDCPLPVLDATPGSSTGSVKLATSISSTQPVYADAVGNSSAASTSSFHGSAILPLAGIKRGSIVVEPFRTGEYEAIMKILQLD